jgi:hypothetical protein
MRRVQWLVAVIAMVATSGCALMTTRGPTDVSGKTRPACTRSLRPTTLDLGIGTAAGVVGLVGGVKMTDYHEPAGYSIIVSAVGAILGFYGSAALGYYRVNRCKEAISEYNFRAKDPILDDDATGN